MYIFDRLSTLGRIITRTIKYELRYAICYIREKIYTFFAVSYVGTSPSIWRCFPTLMTISRSVKSTQEVYVMLLTKSLFCVWSQLIGNVNSTKSGGEALDLLPTISPWLNNNRLAIFTSLIIAVHHLKCFVIGLLVNTCNKLIGGARVVVNFFFSSIIVVPQKNDQKIWPSTLSI